MMDDIIYKDVLENKKQSADSIRWTKVHWPDQHRWGTTAVKFSNAWESGSGVLVCRYTLDDSDQMSMDSVSPEFKRLLKSLDRIMHVRRISRHRRIRLRHVFGRSRSRRRRRHH